MTANQHYFIVIRHITMQRNYYTDRFQLEDHVRLRDSISQIRGKFILSYNDCPEIRKLYIGYTLIEVDRQDNLVSKTNPRRYKELIIKNY